jgi:hypothetical protein
MWSAAVRPQHLVEMIVAGAAQTALPPVAARAAR